MKSIVLIAYLQFVGVNYPQQAQYFDTVSACEARIVEMQSRVDEYLSLNYGPINFKATCNSVVAEIQENQ